MHTTAYDTGRLFFQTYARPHHVTCLDVGSYDLNGSLRSLSPPHIKYVGVDLEAGPGVDVVLQDPHKLPFVSNMFDLIVSSSCFEHDSMFWLTFLECVRVLKPHGVLYVSAPSNGKYHAHPQDNWRFYPDSGLALTAWAQKQGEQVFLVESFLTRQRAEGQWNDCVMIFSKGDPAQFQVNQFVSDVHAEAYNVRNMNSPHLIKFQEHTQDHEVIHELQQKLVHAAPQPQFSQSNPATPVTLSQFSCHVCGNTHTYGHDVLWPALIQQWQLTHEQATYINQQQGIHCAQCHNNLRSVALAKAISDSLLLLPEWIAANPEISLLEINTAGTLSPWLSKLPRHKLVHYPEVDMLTMPYADASWDLIVHSDTLEHVSDPVQALRECYRILKPSGRMCFTVPQVVERLTRSRQGMPNSYHGSPAIQEDALKVHTEFGADTWRWCMEAGFNKVAQHAVCYPAGIAITAHK